MTDATASSEGVLVPDEMLKKITAVVDPVIEGTVQDLIDIIHSAKNEWDSWRHRGTEGYAARELGVMAPVLYAGGIGRQMAALVAGDDAPEECMVKLSLEFSSELSVPAEALKTAVEASPSDTSQAKINFIEAAALVLGKMLVEVEAI